MGESDLNRLFREGLVFGFDVGTASLGYAVRRGAEFSETGVLVLEEDVGDLSGRRGLRRQRRTLRSRKHRLRCLSERLAAAGLPRAAASTKDPVETRLAAVRGESVPPGDLHAAILHLFRRRGYGAVPWAREAEEKKDKEEGEIKKAVSDLSEELASKKMRFPCEWMSARRAEGHPTRGKSARRIVWPRELIQAEFLAICEAQSERYPRLAATRDEILRGDSVEKNGARVYFSKSDAPRPGILALAWPRFDNRGPGLDVFRPYDDEGRPVHRARRTGDLFAQAQLRLAVQNFRLRNLATRRLEEPPRAFRDGLWEVFRKEGKVDKRALARLLANHAPGFELLEDQKPLTPSNASKIGRSAYSRPSLRAIRDTIEAGHRVDPPPPRLRYDGEPREEAIDRLLSGISHPLVRHRAEVFRRSLHRLVSRHGKPDLIVVEAVRDIARGEEAKKKIKKIQKENEEKNAKALDRLRGWSLSATPKNKKRAAHWIEVGGTCPYCLKPISQDDFRTGGAEIEHIVPRSRFPSNDWNNLTLAHLRCNQEKGDRTPFEAYGSDEPRWAGIRDQAEKRFRYRKRALFLSTEPETLLKNQAALAETAYLARVLRDLSHLALGWEGEDGRDPTSRKGLVRFQVTNGGITSALRRDWGLDAALHPVADKDSEEAWETAITKNRSDVRHHALDAMVIASTLPWMALRRAQDGGWFRVDEKKRVHYENPAGLCYETAKEHIEKNSIEITFLRPHAKKAQHYKTTLLGRRVEDDELRFVAREPLNEKTNLDKVYPEALGDYLRAAADRFGDSFPSRVCFSDFQRTRAKGGSPEYPRAPRIPIRSVRVRQAEDPSGVMEIPRGLEKNPFVKRGEMAEVHVYEDSDGVRTPVFIPHYRKDPIRRTAPPPQGTRLVLKIRKGDILETVDPIGPAKMTRFRIDTIGQIQPTLVPAHFKGKSEALVQFGMKKSGFKPTWKNLLRDLKID